MIGRAKFPVSILAPGVAISLAFALAIPIFHELNRLATGQKAQWLGVTIAGLTLALLAGVRFGLICGARRREFRASELAPCLVALLIAVAAFAIPMLASIGLLIAGYLLFALWDVLAVERGLLPQWLGLLRMWITSVAVMFLLAMLAGNLI